MAVATFERGPGTLKVSYELHVENRARLVREMREKGHTAGALALRGGDQAQRYSTDNEPLFRQESYFHWAFGVLEGGCFGTVDLASGKSTLLVIRFLEEYAF